MADMRCNLEDEAVEAVVGHCKADYVFRDSGLGSGNLNRLNKGV
jgi:hypothetical protein